MDPTQWDPLAAAATILAAVITIVGASITNSISRATKLKVAEQRLAAYQKLWKDLEPGKFSPNPEKPFDAQAREELATRHGDDGLVLRIGDLPHGRLPKHLAQGEA